MHHEMTARVATRRLGTAGLFLMAIGAASGCSTEEALGPATSPELESPVAAAGAAGAPRNGDPVLAAVNDALDRLLPTIDPLHAPAARQIVGLVKTGVASRNPGQIKAARALWDALVRRLPAQVAADSDIGAVTILIAAAGSP